MHLAARRLRIEQELACDAAVLAAGMSASAYADHLFDIARRSTLTPSGPATVAMARRSHLEVRIQSILDPDRSRLEPGRRIRIAVGCVAGVAALATGTLQ